MKNFRMFVICSTFIFTTAMTLSGCGGGGSAEAEATPTTSFIPPAVSAPSPPQIFYKLRLPDNTKEINLRGEESHTGLAGS